MKRIKTPYGSFNTYINRLPECDDTFSISFVDKNNKSHIVLMQCICESWVMINAYLQTEWILKLLPQFILMVEQETALATAA
jgi:hypothetical protein